MCPVSARGLYERSRQGRGVDPGFIREVCDPEVRVGEDGSRFEFLVDLRGGEHLGGVGPGAESFDAFFEVVLLGPDQVPGRVEPAAADLLPEPLVLVHPGHVQLEIVAGELVVGVDPGETRRGRAGTRFRPVDQHYLSPGLGETVGNGASDDTCSHDRDVQSAASAAKRYWFLRSSVSKPIPWLPFSGATRCRPRGRTGLASGTSR